MERSALLLLPFHIHVVNMHTCISILHFRSLKNDLSHLSDGVDNLADWRLKESLALSKLVQNRIEYLQVGDMVLDMSRHMKKKQQSA